MENTARELTAERTIAWVQTNVYPTPRHRVPQRVDRKSVIGLSVPIVPLIDAPVAYVVPTEVITHGGVAPGEPRILRVYNDRLYELARENVGRSEPQPIEATETWLEKVHLFSYDLIEADTEEQMFAKALAKFARYESIGAYIVVDGYVWVRTGEPVYKIDTYGLGHNHSHTALSIGVAPTHEGVADDYYWPADQFADAVHAAIGVASDRGDTNSYEKIRGALRIEVTGAHQPGSEWSPAPRIEYADHWTLTPETYHRELAQFRAVLSGVDGAIVEFIDDEGIIRQRVNFDRLSQEQGRDFRGYLEYGAKQGLL